MTTYHDPIIEEIHQTREKLRKEYAGDMAAYSRSAYLHCKSLGFKFATLTSMIDSQCPSRQIAEESTQ